jgi:hypothetical protein
MAGAAGLVLVHEDHLITAKGSPYLLRAMPYHHHDAGRGEHGGHPHNMMN